VVWGRIAGPAERAALETVIAGILSTGGGEAG